MAFEIDCLESLGVVNIRHSSSENLDRNEMPAFQIWSRYACVVIVSSELFWCGQSGRKGVWKKKTGLEI